MGNMQKAAFERVLAQHADYDCKVYIETGLMGGDRFLIAAECFKAVHGVELDQHWYNVTKARAERFPHVNLHHGDTRIVLPALVERYAQTPCLFYLDAHYCKTDPPIQKSEFPLWGELECIKKRKTKDIVLVDDVHTFGLSRPELRFTPNAVEWEGVTKASLTAYFGSQVRDSMEISDSFVIWKEPEAQTPSES